MARFTTDRVVFAFHAGEISKRAAGRADVARTQNACRVLRNMTVGVYGSAKRRPGMVKIAEAKTT